MAALVALVKRSSRALAVGLGTAVLLWTVTFSAIAATYPWGSTLYLGLAVGRRYQPIYALWTGAAMITVLCAALALAQVRLLWPSLRWRGVLGIPTFATVVAWGTVVMLADTRIANMGGVHSDFPWLWWGLPIAVIALIVGLAQVAWERSFLRAVRTFVKSWWIWF